MSNYNQIKEILDQRIMIIDGAMGTMIQKYSLTEEDYRGTQFKDWKSPLKGNNDLLSITQPQIILDIHREFLKAGADILETNTFNANRVSMGDYHMEALVKEMNVASVKLARQAVDEYNKLTPEKPRFVAGSLGPTNKTGSLSPDVNNPGYRAILFDELKEIYREQTIALLDEGVDILLVETVFDTLNAKAAIFAINELKEERNIDIPVMASGTITDQSGRTLSGQTPEAFWNSMSHGDLLSIGLNCALGADQMHEYIQELSRCSWIYVSCYPNAGLPNEFGEYDDTPDHMAGVLGKWCEAGWVNIVGGCCGTTPEHIKAIAAEAAKHKPRQVPELSYH